MRIVIPNQPANTRLIIKARSKTGSTYSDWSRNFAVTTEGDKVAPKTPTNPAASMAGTSFILKWDAVTESADGNAATDLDRYEVKVSSSGSIKTIVFSTNDTKFEFPYSQNLAAFGTAQSNVQMQVRAVDSSGNASEYTAIASQTNPAPSAPTNLIGSVGVDQLDFSWDGVNDTDLQYYRLYMGPTSGSQTTLVWSGLATSATVKTTDYSTNRYYKVVAADVFGTESADSNIVGPLKPNSTTGVDSDPPAVPTGLAGMLTNSTDGKTASMAITWTAVTANDLDSYVIGFRQKSSPVNDWQYTTVDKAATSTTIQGLVPYKDYDIRIRAKDFSANYSAWTTIVNVTAQANTAPAVPTGLAMTAGKDNIQLSWTENTELDMVNNAGTYDVTVATNSGFTTGVLQYRTSNTTLAVNGLASNTTYYARVRATDSAGLSSAYSTSVNKTTSNFSGGSDGAVPTGAPTLSASAGLGYIYLSWTPVANNDPVIYDVYMSSIINFSATDASTKITEVSGTSAFIDTVVSGASLAYNTPYYFRVRARDKDGSSASLSNQATATPLQAGTADLQQPVNDTLNTLLDNIAERVNLAVDPAATSTSSGATVGPGWLATWYGPNGATGTTTLLTGITGPVPGLTTAIRKKWDTDGNAGDTGFQHSDRASGYPMTPGATYTVSSYLRANTTATTPRTGNVRVYFYDSANALVALYNGPIQNLNPTTWTRVSHTFQVPENTVSAAIWTEVSGSTPFKAGDTADGTGLLVEKVGVLYPYFDGSTPNTSSRTNKWTAGVNTSSSRSSLVIGSVQAAQATADASSMTYIQSTQPPVNRSQDLWIDTTGGANTPKRWNGTAWVAVTDQAAITAAQNYTDGKFAATLKNSVVEYAVNSSETVAPTTGWSTATPTRTPGTFVWYRTTLTYGDNTTATSNPALLTGNTGAQGTQGIAGPKGTDGTSLYTWIKYADTPTTGMSDDPTGKAYMGIAYNKTSATESTVYTDYEWTLVKGADGTQGIQGPKGADGQTTYTWIKYATSATGAGLNDSPTGMTYMGIAYNKTTPTESTVATDYEWSLIQGPKGADGATGTNGVSVSSITPYFYQVSPATGAAPATPTASPPPAPWTATEPTYTANTALYRTERIVYSNSTFAYTGVYRSSSYDAAAQAQTTADGKNKIMRSTSDATGSAGFVTGDLWWKIDANGNVIQQWKFVTGTGWITELLNDGVLGSLNANKIVAGTTFTQDLYVKSTFTLGDSTTPGIIKSYDYAAGSKGFKLASNGLEIVDGIVDAKVIKANSSFTTNLFIGTGGAIQSTGYVAGSTGFKLSNTGLVIEGSGNTVSASVLKGGTITGTTINVGAGGVLNVDSTAAIKSNNYSAGSTGYSLGSTGLEVNDGSIDAKVMKTGTAFITDLIVGRSADAVGTVRSYDYSAGNAGWKIGKGLFEVNQGVIKAAALQIQSGASNLEKPQYSAFEFTPSFYNNVFASLNATPSIQSTGGVQGSQFLRVTSTAASSSAIFLGDSSTDYHIAVEAGKTYIVSAWMKASTATDVSAYLRFKYNDSSFSAVPTAVTLPASGPFVRYSWAITVPANITNAVLQLNNNTATAGVGIDIDGVMVEQQIGSLTTPSTYAMPGMTSADGGFLRTGEIRSNANVTVNGTSQPAWSINMAGGAQFGDALVRGKIVVGPTTPVEYATNGNMEGDDLSAFTLYANSFMSTTSMARTTTAGEVISGTGSLKFTGTDTSSSSSSMGFEVPLGSGIPDSNSINFTFKLLYLSTTTVDEQTYAMVQLLDSSGTVIKQKPVVFSDNTNFIVQGGTKTASSAITVPSGYTAAKMRIVAQPRLAGTHRFIFDDISITASADLGASSISSGNYVQNAAGWRLNSSGVGEFNDVNVRGIIGTGSAGKRIVMGDKFNPGYLGLYSGNAYEWSNGFITVNNDASLTLYSGYVGNTVPATPTGSGAGGAGGAGQSYSMGYMTIGPITDNPAEYGFQFGYTRQFMVEADMNISLRGGGGLLYMADKAMTNQNASSLGTLFQGTDVGPMTITQNSKTMTISVTDKYSTGSSSNIILSRNSIALNSTATGTSALNAIGGNVGEQLMFMTRAMSPTAFMGGGNVSVDSSWNLSWSNRFMIMNNGRGVNTDANGYFNIDMPTVGTVIPGYGGTPSVTVTSAGILLNTWSTLYYEMGFGGTGGSNNANFRVVGYTADFVIPNNWIRIATRNNDLGCVSVANGLILQAGQTDAAVGTRARGAMDYAGITATTATTTSTTAINVPGMSVTWLARQGRRYKVEAWVQAYSTVANDRISINIVDNANGAQLVGSFILAQSANIGYPIYLCAYFNQTSADASRNFVVRYGRSAGTGSVAVVAGAQAPAYIAAEDVGPVI